MSLERDKRFLDFDEALQSVIEDFVLDKSTDSQDAHQAEIPSPSESALSEFRSEYARRVKEAFSSEKLTNDQLTLGGP